MSGKLDPIQSSMPNIRKPYIPKKIRLPGPFVVTVNQIIPTKMQEKHGQIYDGIWDSEKMELDLNVRLPHKRRWYVFGHEMVHVVNDWIHWLVNNEIAQG